MEQRKKRIVAKGVPARGSLCKRPQESYCLRMGTRILAGALAGLLAAHAALITSDFVPRSIATVEKVIAESGLLQTYGRIKQR